MQLSYAAYNPVRNELFPGIPSGFMQEPYDNESETARINLERNGFSVREFNYDGGSDSVVAHTIGYREIAINENSEQNTTGGNNNDWSSEIAVLYSGNISDNTNKISDSGSRTGRSNVSTISAGSDSELIYLTDENSEVSDNKSYNAKQLVVVVVRGSVTQADWAMELSYAAYNYPTDTELPPIPGWFMGDVVDTAADVLCNHGFVETQIQENNYDVDPITQERDPTAAGAHTIAYRDIEFPVAENTTNNEGEEDYDSNMGSYQSNISGVKYDSIYTDGSDTGSNRSTVLLSETDTTNNTRRIVVVAVRGSVTDSDWDNNMITQFVPCDNKFAEMKNTVVDNLENHISDLSNSIILITGHSLGAAIANLLAAELSSTLGVENVYAYTFATPQVVTESLGQEAIPYGNIFNILNSNDVVTYMPTTLIVPFANFWSRHGIDIPLNMPYNEYIPTEPIGVFCHSMAVYMAWMENNPDMTYESIMEESSEARTRGILPWIVKIKCPVGVTVKNSEDKIIAYESLQEGITYPEITDTGIVSWIDEDGAKVFALTIT